jgi:hypothetical protein
MDDAREDLPHATPGEISFATSVGDLKAWSDRPNLAELERRLLPDRPAAGPRRTVGRRCRQIGAALHGPVMMSVLVWRPAVRARR